MVFTITIYRTLNGSEQHIFMLTVLEVRVSTWVFQGVGRAVFLLEVRGENPLSCLFQLPEAAHMFWLLASYSIFRASSESQDPPHIISPCLLCF